MNKLLFFIAAVLAAFIVKTGFAQVDLSQKAPMDPQIRYGVLDNGLTYYIRHNEEPKERASFYIIQNVGALLEEDDQNGLAHFLEHMAFNGTQHFEGKGILNTLQKHGVAFGRNINAYTAFTETVYNLSDVPTTHSGLVDTCLLILNDWSDFLLLTEEEINNERGVITEEWRTRRNASFRLREQWFPVVFKGSKYAVRDVIGDTTVIRYHKPETLRKFYYDWYRSDLQAIAIVGDINVDEIELKVKELFAKIPKVENPKPKPNFDIPEHDETYFVLATDKEAAQSQISIYILNKKEDKQPKDLNHLRDQIIENLYNSMTSTRIEELLQKGVPPFVNGYTQKGDFVRGYDAYMIGAVAKPNEEDKALEAILIETERIKRHGFTSSELERAKANLLTGIESNFKQKDKINNDSFCDEIAEHYLTGQPTTGIDFYFPFAKAIVPTITVDEISAKANEWIKETNRSIVITGPSEGVTHITQPEAMDILAKVKTLDIEPYNDGNLATTLIPNKLKGSKVVKTKKIEELGAVEWTLANNVKVVYRHADYEKDNVSFKAISLGGTSLWDDKYVPSAGMVSTFVESYGIGDFDATTLQKMLTGKKVSMNPTFGDLTEGFNGSSTPKDFETMMQLAYLYFEKPRFDKEAFDALMSRYMSYVANLENDPRKAMQDSLTFINANYHPRARTIGTKFLQEVSFEDIEKIYRDRIQDAGDFTFIIVGNIEEDTAKAMAVKYLGSLTDSKRKENWIDRKVEAPKGKTEKVIPIKLTTPKANVNVRFVSDMEYTMKNALMMMVLKGILDLRYTETVREDEGGTYGVGVSGGLTQFPTGKASLGLNFDCDPVKAERLKSIIFREIDKIKADGPTAVDFDKTIKNMLKDREQSREHNSFYMSALYNLYISGLNTADPANFEKILESMATKDIQEYASNFFDKANLIDIVFVPKSE